MTQILRHVTVIGHSENINIQTTYKATSCVQQPEVKELLDNRLSIYIISNQTFNESRCLQGKSRDSSLCCCCYEGNIKCKEVRNVL